MLFSVSYHSSFLLPGDSCLPQNHKLNLILPVLWTKFRLRLSSLIVSLSLAPKTRSQQMIHHSVPTSLCLKLQATSTILLEDYSILTTSLNVLGLVMTNPIFLHVLSVVTRPFRCPTRPQRGHLICITKRPVDAGSSLVSPLSPKTAPESSVTNAALALSLHLAAIIGVNSTFLNTSASFDQ